MAYSLDFAIKERKEELKELITRFEKELSNRTFDVIYDNIDSIYLKAALTALLLKNNINPLIYMKKIPSCFAYKLDIKEFVIPDNVISIGSGAFENCSILTDVIIGSGTTYIYNYAFNNCERLASITIPKSVVYIGRGAFRNCSKLKDVYYEGSEEDWKNIEIEWWCNELLRNVNIHYNS